MVSLFARAMVLPAFTAAKVGIRPADPAIAETMISASEIVEMRISPSMPERTSTLRFMHRSLSSLAAFSLVNETIDGLKRLICDSILSIFSPALRPTTLNRSGKRETTSSVLVPMEPVEPNIEILFTI